MKQRGLAYILLIAFGVLLTPRSFWHDCDDHHSTKQTSGVHFDKKCFACDYDMNAGLEPLQFSYRFQQPVYHISQVVQNHLVELQYVESDCLRGPPVI